MAALKLFDEHHIGYFIPLKPCINEKTQHMKITCSVEKVQSKQIEAIHNKLYKFSTIQSINCIKLQKMNAITKATHSANIKLSHIMILVD